MDDFLIDDRWDNGLLICSARMNYQNWLLVEVYFIYYFYSNFIYKPFHSITFFRIWKRNFWKLSIWWFCQLYNGTNKVSSRWKPKGVCQIRFDLSFAIRRARRSFKSLAKGLIDYQFWRVVAVYFYAFDLHKVDSDIAQRLW